MSQEAAEKIAARLAELWRTSRPTILERMSALHDACAALEVASANQAARDTGREAAHKLSGVLGIFGMPQGSEIASAIEALLQSPAPLAPGDLLWLYSRIVELDAVIAAKSS